jgi:ABC-2 type transport system ATP-binding protein
VGTPNQLRRRVGLDRLVARVSVGDLQSAERVARAAPRVQDVQRFGDRLDILLDAAPGAAADVDDALTSAGVDVTSMRLTSPTLDNAFVALLRREAVNGATVQFPNPRRHAHTDVAAIRATNISKRFGGFQAVKDVSLAVRPGEIYGLLGANGAGKTTTIKMLCGLVEPTAGSTFLAGATGPLRAAEVRRRVGYMSQKFSLYDDLTIDENLEFFAGVYGVPTEHRLDRKRWVLDFSGLRGRETVLTGTLPGGWKQRVAFGAAVMHEPSVLFLDEPTSGIDPLARRAFWRAINEFADRGVAILVTTHYLEEAEQCNRLGLLVAGELVAEGTPFELKASQAGRLLEVLTDRPQRAIEVLRKETGRWRVSLLGERLHVIVDDDPKVAMANVTSWLVAGGAHVLDVYEEPMAIEDVFIAVVEQMRFHGKVSAE